MNTWTVLELIKTTTEYLEKRGIPDPRLDAEYLLGHVLDLKRLELYLVYDRPLEQSELGEYRALIKRRGTREPLQHILGETDFMGHTFKINSNVLIPRPESEILVESVLDLLPDDALKVLDIGTGSGCLAIALAAKRPAWKITALDISESALELARWNAQEIDVADRISFQHMDILVDSPTDMYDLIISNPPYIAESEAASLEPEVREYDPTLALFASGNGLAFYRRFAQLFPGILKPAGRFALEFGGKAQESVLMEMFTQAGLSELTTTSDYNGMPRVLTGRLNPSTS